MGRGIHCSVEKRKTIYHMHEKGIKQAKIAELLNCSKKMVYNAISAVQSDPNLLNEAKKRKPRPRKTTTRQDTAIVRKAKVDPFKSSRVIANEINDELGANVSSRLVRLRLNEANLYGRVSRKKPYLTKSNIDQRLHFAREHRDKNINYWKRVLFSDETKVNRIAPDGKTYVHRKKNEAFNPRYTTKIVQHGGGNIKIWGCFSWHGVGPLYRIDGNMDQFQYLSILQTTMEPYTFESMPLNWIFMQDNDPKHTARIVKNWLTNEKIHCLDWPARSPDLNPIENLWNEVKIQVGQKNCRNNDELWAEIQEAWYSIPLERCQKLIESMVRRCSAVIQNKGYSTKY